MEPKFALAVRAGRLVEAGHFTEQPLKPSGGEGTSLGEGEIRTVERLGAFYVTPLLDRVPVSVQTSNASPTQSPN